MEWLWPVSACAFFIAWLLMAWAWWVAAEKGEAWRDNAIWWERQYNKSKDMCEQLERDSLAFQQIKAIVDKRSK